MRILVPIVGAVLCLGHHAVAKTWYVGGSGADFAQIQPAIDAAQDGDVILVRPGTYLGFALYKGVIVRSSSAPFVVKPDCQDAPVTVTGIGISKRGGIAGMTIEDQCDTFTPKQSLLSLSECAGEVVLADIIVLSQWGDGFIAYESAQCLTVDNCSNVSVTNLLAETHARSSFRGAVQITSSAVRLDDAQIIGGKQLLLRHDAGDVGPPGLEVVNSRLIIARTTIVGGEGGDGNDYVNPGNNTYGGKGGSGLLATSSDVVIVGDDSSTVLRGGQGGDSGFNPWCNCWTDHGGDGGNGFDGMSATASRALFEPGAGGDGTVDGQPGLPWTGNVIENDVVPLLTTSADFHPGGSFTLAVELVDAGTLVLVFADHQGFADVWGNGGPPLSAVPFAGGRFLLVPAGHFASGATIELHLRVPALTPPGTTMHMQSVLLGDLGSLVLSNAVSRIVRE